jgi:excisionase family DNA binding protein
VPSPRLLKLADAAEYLGTTPRHIRELQYRRELPFVKIGRSVRFDLRDLDLYIEMRKTPAVGW